MNTFNYMCEQKNKLTDKNKKKIELEVGTKMVETFVKPMLDK